MPFEAPPSTSLLQSILNFRDVGQTINEALGEKIIREGLLFRSARPDEASPSDKEKLTTEYGIRTIIDLRSKSEHISQARAHTTTTTTSSLTTQTNSSTPTPLEIQIQIPKITYHEISLNGKSFERALIKHLTWSQFAHLLYLMALGRRTEGIAILGRNVMAPLGLTGLGFQTLEYSRGEIRRIFEILACTGDEGEGEREAKGETKGTYPVLIHCTQGKDRTGLVVLLILLLLLTPGDESKSDTQENNTTPPLSPLILTALQHDYMLTATALIPERASRLKEIQNIGLPAQFADCDETFVEAVVSDLQRRGGVEAYLGSCGVGGQVMGRVRGGLLVG